MFPGTPSGDLRPGPVLCLLLQVIHSRPPPPHSCVLISVSYKLARVFSSSKFHAAEAFCLLSYPPEQHLENIASSHFIHTRAPALFRNLLRAAFRPPLQAVAPRALRPRWVMTPAGNMLHTLSGLLLFIDHFLHPPLLDLHPLPDPHGGLSLLTFLGAESQAAFALSFLYFLARRTLMASNATEVMTLKFQSPAKTSF